MNLVCLTSRCVIKILQAINVVLNVVLQRLYSIYLLFHYFNVSQAKRFYYAQLDMQIYLSSIYVYRLYRLDNILDY